MREFRLLSKVQNNAVLLICCCRRDELKSHFYGKGEFLRPAFLG